MPDGQPPKELEIDDITEGEGTEAAAGDTLTMQYVGVNYSNGEEFDSSWDSRRAVHLPARRRQRHPRLGSGNRRNEGRRSPSSSSFRPTSATARRAHRRTSRRTRRSSSSSTCSTSRPRPEPAPRSVAHANRRTSRPASYAAHAGRGTPRDLVKQISIGWLWAPRTCVAVSSRSVGAIAAIAAGAIAAGPASGSADDAGRLSASLAPVKPKATHAPGDP